MTPWDETLKQPPSQLTVDKQDPIFVFIVYCLAYITGVQVSGHDNRLTVGESVMITCSFDLNLTSMEWLYDNTVIMRTTAPQLDLTFSLVNDSIHNRQYTCRVVTSYGTQEETITLRVQGRIKFL